MICNFPGVTKQDLSPDLLKHLAVDCPVIAGLKDTVDTLSHIRWSIHVHQGCTSGLPGVRRL